MLSLLLLPQAAAEGGAGAAPYLIAVSVLVLLLGILFALLAFGKGRDHS